MIAGVDGCKRGWLVALGDGWPTKSLPKLKICADFKAVLEATRDCQVVAIDMPIGLTDGADERECDLLARKALSPGGGSRVFPAPRRPAR